MTDEELVKRILKRDFEALGELFKRYEKSFYNLAYRYTGDHYSADDLASEIFLRIYRYLPSFKSGSGSFKNWAMKVGVNTCLTYSVQSTKNRVQSLTVNDETPLRPSAPSTSLRTSPLGASEGQAEIELEDKKTNIEKDYEKKEIAERIQAELLKLPEKYRLCLYFYFWEDLSYDEIAKVTEIPLNTVRTNIKRGKERLEKSLSDLL